MAFRTSVTALMLATALGMMIAEALAWDDAKYIDLKGQWVRTIGGAGRYDPTKPLGRLQEAQLAPQYGTGDAGRRSDQATGPIAGRADDARISGHSRGESC